MSCLQVPWSRFPLACLPVGEAIITLACNKQYYSSLPWVIFVERGKKSHTVFIILFPSTFSSSFSCKKRKKKSYAFYFYFPFYFLFLVQQGKKSYGFCLSFFSLLLSPLRFRAIREKFVRLSLSVIR